MSFVKTSSGHYLDSSRVVAVLPPHTRPAITLRDAAKEEGSVINLKGGAVPIRSMCVLDTGQLVLLSMTPDTFVSQSELSVNMLGSQKFRRGEDFYSESDIETEEVEVSVDTSLKIPLR